MYMCIKLHLRDLNCGSYPPPHKFYTCRMTIALRVRGKNFYF